MDRECTVIYDGVMMGVITIGYYRIIVHYYKGLVCRRDSLYYLVYFVYSTEVLFEVEHRIINCYFPCLFLVKLYEYTGGSYGGPTSVEEN